MVPPDQRADDPRGRDDDRGRLIWLRFACDTAGGDQG
jgi:hypothetical protein